MAIDVTFDIAQTPALSFGLEFSIAQARKTFSVSAQANMVVGQTGPPDEVEATFLGKGQHEVEASYLGFSQTNLFTATFTADQDRQGQLYTGRLLHYLPAEYEVQDTNEDLKQYLEVVAVSADEFYDFIDKFTEIFDPDICDRKYLVYLAKLIGYPLSTRGFDSPTPAVGEAAVRRARTQLKQAVEVYKRKGLKEAFQILFYSLGYYIELVELWTNNYMTFLPDVPSGQTLYHPTKNPDGWYKSPYFGIKLFQVSQVTTCSTTDSGAGQSGGWSPDDLAEVLEAVHQIRPVHTVLWWLEYFFDLCDIYEFTDFNFEGSIESAFLDKFFDCAPDDPLYYRDDERLLGVTRNGTDSLAITHVRDPQEGFCDGDYHFSAEIGDIDWEEKMCSDVTRGCGELYRDGSNLNPRNGINPTRDPACFSGRNGGRSTDSPLSDYFRPPTATAAVTGEVNYFQYDYYVVAKFPGGFQAVSSPASVYTSEAVQYLGILTTNLVEWDDVGATSYDVYRAYDKVIDKIGDNIITLSLVDSQNVRGSSTSVPDSIMSSNVFDRSGCYGLATDNMDVLYQIGEEAEDGTIAYYNKYEFKNWLDTVVVGPGPDPDILGRDIGRVAKLQVSTSDLTDSRTVHGNGLAVIGNDVYSVFGRDGSNNAQRTVTKLTFSSAVLQSATTLSPTGAGRFYNGAVGVYDNKVHWLYGRIATDALPTGESYNNFSRVYDPTTNAISPGFFTDSFIESLEHMAYAQVGNNLYTFGGSVFDPTPTTSNYAIRTELDTGVQSLTIMPVELKNSAAIAVNEYIYIYGGTNSAGVAQSTLLRYNTITQTIDPLPNGPIGSAKPTVIKKNNSLFFFTAVDWDNGAPRAVTALEYNLTTQGWSHVIITDATSGAVRPMFVSHAGRHYGTGSFDGTARNMIQVVS